MFKKKILTVIISLILAVIINGVPVENSEADAGNTKNTKDSKNGSRTIAIKVPPEIKHGTPRPMLFIFNAAKPTTSTAPSETKGQDTEAVKAPTVEKGSSPRPEKTEAEDASTPTSAQTNNTVAPSKDNPTTTSKEPPVEKDGTPRPLLFLYSNPNTTTASPQTSSVTPTVTPTPKTPSSAPTETTGPKGNNPLIMAIKVPSGEEGGTPRPILFIYSPDNTTVTPKISTSSAEPDTSDAPTSDSAVLTSTTAPNVSTKSPGTYPVENNGTPHPMSWINPDTPSSPDDPKRPMNLLRGYSCPKRNGYFRYPDKCDVYIICKDYIPLTYICPEGLQFNANAQKHESLCDVPSVAKCGNDTEVSPTTERDPVVIKNAEKDGKPHPILFIKSRSTTARPDTSTGLPSNVLPGYSCPKRNGFFSYPGKCDVYIVCEDYTPLTYICPDGLQFNPQEQRPDLVCDDPSVVKCGMDEPDRKRPAQRPVQETSPALVGRLPWSNIRRFSCPTANGYFRFSEQCDEYVECRVYTPLRYICPEGLHFDPDARWTEYPCVEPSLARCRGP